MKFLKNLIAKLLSYKLRELDKLYQIHDGQECYIFGDGMSVKWMDINQFKNHPAIMGNFSIYHKDSANLDVKYCTIIEPYFFFPYFPYKGPEGFKFVKHYLHQEFKKTIKSRKKTKFFINISNYPVLFFKNVLFVQKNYRPPFEYKNPFAVRTDTHDGTFRFQVSLAIFLGFKKAYLVGHDYTHSPARNLHYYEKGEGSTREIEGFCKEFLEYAKQHIELVTVTLDGKSKALKSITYEELTGLKPNYKENNVIVPLEKLKALSSWKGYQIF